MESDPEIKQLLQKTLELAEENNKMLRKVRGVQKRQTIWNIFKIIMIVGIAFGSFYFLEPYLNKGLNAITSITGGEQNLDSNSLQNLLKQINP